MVAGWKPADIFSAVKGCFLSPTDRRIAWLGKPMPEMSVLLMLGVFTVLAMPPQLCAHDPGLSAASFSADEKQLVAHLSVAQSDLQTLAAPHDKSRLAAIGHEAFELSLDGHQLAILAADAGPEIGRAHV